MSEAIANELLEIATAISGAADLLDKFQARELPPIARAHLGVAHSGLLHARRQVNMVMHALDPDQPGSADASTPPPRRD